jgi:Fe2+ or Zn2+ uptake regulation protein
VGVEASDLLRAHGLRVTPPNDFGYEIDEAEVIYWGRCPECRDEKGTS